MSKACTQCSRPKTRYRTRNWRAYDRELIARGDLTIWISPDLSWHAEKGTGRRGRPPVFSDAAIQAVLTLKVLYQPSLRAARGMAGSLRRLAGLDWKVPGEGEWKVRQHGADKRRAWRKVHPIIDADSHELRAVEMNDHGDGEIVPGLLAQLPNGGGSR